MQLSSDSGKDEVFPKLSFSKGIRIREEKLDYLQTRISAYLIKISRSELNEQESQEVIALMNIVKTLESIGDFIGILEEKLAEKKRALKNDLSEEGKHDLMEMHKMVCLEVEQLVDALKNMDGAKAATLLQGDEQFKPKFPSQKPHNLLICDKIQRFCVFCTHVNYVKAFVL